MARGRRDHSRARWLLPAALTLTAAVATAGVYFWREMEDNEAATGFRSEDEETADEKRKTRGMAGRSFGQTAGAAGAGITGRVSEIWKEFFQGSSDESEGGRRSRAGPSMTGPARPSSSGASSSSMGRGVSVSRSMPPPAAAAVPVLGNSQEIDWEKKRIIALVISGNEELDESLLLSLPVPVDISRWILLIFVKSKSSNNNGYSSMSEIEAPTPSVSSNYTRRLGSSIRSRSRSSRRRGDSDDDDMSEETSVDNSITLPGMILKTFGRDFPHQQVMHYSTPTGVVHMLRHLGVSLVFLSESCASVPSADNNNNSSSDEGPGNLPGSLPMSPPPGTTPSVGGGEIVGMLQNWVGEIILVLDEEEDDSAPIVPSAVSGGEDDYDERRRRQKGKDYKHTGAVSEATGRKRRWLKDKNIARGITICDRQGLKGIWRAKVEGVRP